MSRLSTLETLTQLPTFFGNNRLDSLSPTPPQKTIKPILLHLLYAKWVNCPSCSRPSLTQPEFAFQNEMTTAAELAEDVHPLEFVPVLKQ